MKEVFSIISVVLYFLVGIICLVMAFKSIAAKKYLPFHEEASGKPWQSIEKPLQDVIITILRISGLGFLIVFLLLTVFPIVSYFRPNDFIKYSVPVLSLIYCFGLFLFNYLLFRKTKAKTPWMGSLIALFIILLSFTISAI
jgi:hypothetical protein